MSDFVGLTVGRIVHFFTKHENLQSNGQGEGPYPAIVLQVFDDGKMGNLKVMTYSKDHVSGSVVHKSVAEEKGGSSWWDWPPRT